MTIELSTHSSLRQDLPIKSQHLLEEILQLTLCKYEGRPSWALSSNRMFTGPCPTRDKYGFAFDEFLEKRKVRDPKDIFMPPLFKRVVDRRGADYYTGKYGFSK